MEAINAITRIHSANQVKTLKNIYQSNHLSLKINDDHLDQLIQ